MKINISIEERLTAGIILFGYEVKPILNNQFDIKGSYAFIKENQLFIIGMHVHPAKTTDQFSNIDPRRDRNLKITKSELRFLKEKFKKGYSIIPEKVFYEKGKVRVSLAIGKPLKKWDKREKEKEKEFKREVQDYY
jgi:SsrA-binding protein